MSLFFNSPGQALSQLRHALKSLRRLQLYVTFLNLVNRNVIFTFKLFCIGTCIVSGYAAIAHFEKYPIFGVVFYVIFFDALQIYVVLYEKGFKVPALFEKAKDELMLRSSEKLGKAERNMLQMQLRSIPSMGIKVGEFHMLERNSTPVFLHYVLTNIVNMLVAYK